MQERNRRPRRQRVEPGIYTRTDAGGRDVFEIGFRDAQGRQRWRRVHGGIKAARAALAVEHSKRSRGVRVSADPRLTFNMAADAWWEVRSPNVRPTTQATYTSSLKHLRRRFGRARLVDICPADVAEFVTAQHEVGFKGWTIRGQLTVLSAVYKHASRHLGFVGTNPIASLDRLERPGIGDERPKRVLTTDELRRLLAAVDDPYRLLFEFAAETGARLGEVLGVTWGEINLNDGVVRFTHQLAPGHQRVPLKTNRSQRSIEITPALTARLRKHNIASLHSKRHDYVFVTRSGTPHNHRNIGGRVLARAVKRAGLQAVRRDGKTIEPAPTFHNLRHSHGSALIASGWDLEEVSARLGHADVGTTQRAYIHAYDAARRCSRRRDRLAALYSVDDETTPDTILLEVSGQP